MGSLTSGTITGALIQTSASGQRVVMDYSSNTFRVYNSSDVNTIEMGGAANSLYVFGTTSLTPSAAIIQNSTAVPAIYGTNQYSGGAGSSSAIYGFAYTNVGVSGVSTTQGTGLYGGAMVSGGSDNHGIRGSNVSTSGGGVATSGLVGVGNGYDFYAEGGGTNYGPFTGAHDVLVPTGETILLGYIVCDVKLVLAKNISNTIFEVAISSSANQVPIGVMVVDNGSLSKFKPASFIEKMETVMVDNQPVTTTIMYPEYNEYKDIYDYCGANAVGEGQVYVCNENGNIAAGDLIVTSSTAGVGMKQSDNIVRNITVAKAREAITFTDSSPQLVACIYLCG